MEARLPLDKKIRALNEITAVLVRGSATLKELEKLLGLLEFCGNVFPLGRPFLRHVWNMFRGVKFHYGTPRKTCRQRLTAAACHDLQWWQKGLFPFFDPDQGIVRRLLSLNQAPTPTVSATCKGRKRPFRHSCSNLVQKTRPQLVHSTWKTH